MTRLVSNIREYLVDDESCFVVEFNRAQLV